MQSRNIKNFLDLKDDINFKAFNNFVLLIVLLIFGGADILWYVFKLDWLNHISSLLDVCMGSALCIFAIIYFIWSLFIKSQSNIYLSLGLIYIIWSCHLFYISARAALFPVSEYYGLIGVGVWLLTSLVEIYGIFDNIKHDRYRKDNPYFLSFKGNAVERQYIVVSRITIIQLFIPFLEFIAYIIVYSVFPDLYHVEGRTFGTLFYFLFAGTLTVLGLVTNIGWKFIIKAYYEKNREKYVGQLDE